MEANAETQAIVSGAITASNAASTVGYDPNNSGYLPNEPGYQPAAVPQNMYVNPAFQASSFPTTTVQPGNVEYGDYVTNLYNSLYTTMNPAYTPNATDNNYSAYYNSGQDVSAYAYNPAKPSLHEGADEGNNSLNTSREGIELLHGTEDKKEEGYDCGKQNRLSNFIQGIGSK